MNTKVATIAVCVGAAAMSGLGPQPGLAFSPGNQPNKSNSEIATISALPTLGPGLIAEARSVNGSGTVIAGLAWDSNGLMHGAKWTQQNGKWTITALPTPPDAWYAIARGAGDAGASGNDSAPGSTSRAIFWPWTGGFQVLGCNDYVGSATVYGISDGGQIVVGRQGQPSGSRAALWPTTPGSCRFDLPLPANTLYASANAANADGTIVGGSATAVMESFPLRWTSYGGQWQVEQLDNRPGYVTGANGFGDLTGNVTVSYGTSGCALQDGCQRAVIWYVQGGALELGTLGGAYSNAQDINQNDEVVGTSVSPNRGSSPYFWSSSFGMYELPFKGRTALPWALSDVRSDGTRLVVGFSSSGPVVWVVRNP